MLNCYTLFTYFTLLYFTDCTCAKSAPVTMNPSDPPDHVPSTSNRKRRRVCHRKTGRITTILNFWAPVQWRNFGLKHGGTSSRCSYKVGGPSSHSKKWESGPSSPSPWNYACSRIPTSLTDMGKFRTQGCNYHALFSAKRLSERRTRTVLHSSSSSSSYDICSAPITN